MAYIALIDEKLQPALVVSLSFIAWQCLTLYSELHLCVPQLHTFWVDAENYINVTRPWFASRSPFPLNFVVPCRHANNAFSRILLTKGEAPLQRLTEVEAKVNTWLISAVTHSVSSYSHCKSAPLLCKVQKASKICQLGHFERVRLNLKEERLQISMKAFEPHENNGLRLY